MDTLKEVSRQAALERAERYQKEEGGVGFPIRAVADAVTLAVINHIADEITPYYLSASGVRMQLERIAVEFGSPSSGSPVETPQTTEPPTCRICEQPQPCPRHGRTPVTEADYAELSAFAAPLAPAVEPEPRCKVCEALNLSLVEPEPTTTKDDQSRSDQPQPRSCGADPRDGLDHHSVFALSSRSSAPDTVEVIASFVEHLRDGYQSTTEPVAKVARLIRERFGKP